MSLKINKNQQSTHSIFDWPSDGPINLDIHDLPHKSSTTEWWYMHAHITLDNQREVALFASFFRLALFVDKKSGQYKYKHTVIWALSDLNEEKYYTRSLVDKEAPKIGLKHLKDKQSTKDPFIKKATIEMLKKGVVPLPDELLKGDAIIPWDKLHLQYDQQSFRKANTGTYILHLEKPSDGLEINLEFLPCIPPVRHGENGVIYNSAAEDMFYYFIPSCKVSGNIKLLSKKYKVKDGSGWYDHEFGAKPSNKKSLIRKEVAWNWLGIQLSNGFQLSLFDVHTRKTKKNKSTYLIRIHPDGTKDKTKDFSLDATSETWTSTRTFNDYPIHWKLKSKAFNLDINIQAAFGHQEFGTVISKPAFWEGRMNITGNYNKKAITGKAYLERHGHVIKESIPDFLNAVSKQTLLSVKKILPLTPDFVKLQELISTRGNRNFTKAIDKKIYREKLIKPIREIVDRGGKSWRSYATVACCDVVGGNSQEAIDWLALPELIHVGSLMVDDVQDKSKVRRGGPSAHVLYGDGIAINSGCAAYFIGQICILNSNQSNEQKLRIYNWYFEAMRAAHSGQALDITGLDYLMPKAIKSDFVAKSLPARVLAIHRLKSAAPASYLARIGACLGNGTEIQINALSEFFEALGISFQIIDDTLNLKGFKDNNKTKAEDITVGKITYPVAIALSKMNRIDRKKLYQILILKSSDPNVLSEALDLIYKYNAIEISEKIAKQNINRAWKKLDPLLEDSMVKIILRAFGWFVLERTY